MTKRGLLVVVLAVGLLPGGARPQEPELSAEQKKLLKEAMALNTEGVKLYQQVMLPEATKRLGQAIDLFRRAYSRDNYPNGHANLANALHNLGTVLRTQGDHDKAELLTREALEMRRALYPKEKFPQGHPDLADSYNGLATLLQEQGEYSKAEPLFRQALEMRRALYPKDKFPKGHPELATSLANLGLLLQDQGDYDKAEPVTREAVAMLRGLYPKGDPALASALHNLGLLLQEQGKHVLAEPVTREALEMFQALYPKDDFPTGHAALASAMNSLGTLLHEQGEYARAEPVHRQALEMRRGLYPKVEYPNGHPDLVTSLSNLGLVLQEEGEYREAETVYRQALEMDHLLYPKDKYPDGHPDLANSLANLGFLLEEQGEYALAEPLTRQALEMRRVLYPRDEYPNGHPDLAASLTNLGSVIQSQGQLRQAVTLYRSALKMDQALYPKEKFPQGHPNLPLALSNLAGVLSSLGEDAEAETMYRKALEINQALYPRDRYRQGHPNLARSIVNMGTFLHARGDYAKAERLYREALEMNQTLYPNDRYPNGHPLLAHSLLSVGGLLADQKEYPQAEPFVRKALEITMRQAALLARTAPEPLALNFAATFPITRDGLLSITSHLSDTVAADYDAVWHTKAGLTRIYQRRHLALIAAVTDPALRKAWDHLQGLRRQREQLIMTPAPTAEQQAAADTKLGSLNKAIDTAELDLLPKLPVLKHAEDLAKLGPDALRKLLPPDVVLIDFLRYTFFEQDADIPGKKGEKRSVRYLAFVVSRDKVNRVELGAAAEIDAAVRAWRDAITLKLPGDNAAARKEHEARLSRQGEKLRQLVWEPVQKQLGKDVKTVYLAPDDALTQLPWAALPGGDKDRVLLDDYAIAVVPHGPFLLEQMTPPPPRSEKRPPAPEGLLLVGGVKYDDKPIVIKDGQDRKAEEVTGQKVVWGNLKGTEEERQLLLKLLEKSGPKLTVSLAGAEAAAARLRQELERARYAHLATHGFFADKTFRSVLQLNPKLFERTEVLIGDSLFIRQRIGAGARSPLVLSGLVCAGANLPQTPDRGVVSGDAVVGLLLDDLYLAMLSACDTGLGDVAGGEGVYGLQRAFHMAGCQNVVASLWKVDDGATAALMTRFYGYLFHEDKSKRLTSIEALRRAQLDLYRHPELIPAWSKGESRAPGQPRPATTPPPADTPRELLTSEGRAPIKLWAAFNLSGLGK